MTRRTLRKQFLSCCTPLAFLIAAAFGAELPSAYAQNACPTNSGTNQNPTQVFHLVNAAQRNEANDIMTALRNVVCPSDKLFLLETTYDIVAAAPPDQLALMGKLIAELDTPKQTYRLVYTLTESESGKRIGVQHFAMVVVTGQQVTLKQGDKVPVLTGSYDKNSSSQQTEFTYLDVGMSFDSTLDRFANGLRLRSVVLKSSLAESQVNAPGQDPIVRQIELKGTSVIVPGKPQILGSLDIAGSTRHVDVEVIAEPLP